MFEIAKDVGHPGSVMGVKEQGSPQKFDPAAMSEAWTCRLVDDHPFGRDVVADDERHRRLIRRAKERGQSRP